VLIAGDTFATPVLPEAPRITIASPTGVQMRQYLPLVHRPWWILGPTGDFIATPGGGSYTIFRQSLAGDTLLITGRDYAPVVVPDSTRSTEIQGVRPEGVPAPRGFDPDDVPTVYPPFEQLMESTDGTIWVRRYIEGGRMGLDVFAADGQYLGPALVPPDFDRMSIYRTKSEE
jgi:hypothetical protein